MFARGEMFPFSRLSRRDLLSGIAAAGLGVASTISDGRVAAATPSVAGTVPFDLKVGRVGVCVADLALAIKFYTDLGYDEGDLVQEAGLGDLIEIQDVVVHISHRPKHGIEVELLQIGSARAPGIPVRRAMHQQGMTHLALRVDDVDRVAGVIRKNGGTIVESTRTAARSGFGADAVFCTDPDGARILLLGPGEVAGLPAATALGPAGIAFSHFGICVADVALSVQFYKSFGFDVAPVQDRGLAFSGIAEVGDTPLTSCLIRRGAYAFELMQWGRARSPGVPARRSIAQQGFTHIGTSGSDLTGQMALFKAIGGTVIKNAAYHVKGTNIQVVFCTDPDGTRIELVGPVKA